MYTGTRSTHRGPTPGVLLLAVVDELRADGYLDHEIKNVSVCWDLRKGGRIVMIYHTGAICLMGMDAVAAAADLAAAEGRVKGAGDAQVAFSKRNDY